jgi:hypothetical protein
LSLVTAHPAKDQAQRLRVGNSGPIGDNRLRLLCRRITPGELTNRQPATELLKATSRQLSRHRVKVI